MKHFVDDTRVVWLEHDTKASRQYFAQCLRLLCGNNFELNVFVAAWMDTILL